MSVYRRIFSKQYQNLMYPGERLRFDILNPICMFRSLCALGLLFVYSAQISYDGGHWKRQLFFIVAGIGIYSLVSALNYKIFLQYAHIIYMAGVAGLVLTMPFSPISVDQMGARRWIDVGITIQPTEGAKIGTLIMVASILARSEIGYSRRLACCIGKSSGNLLLPMLLIFLQPDLGSSLVFPPMIFALLYVSRLSEKFFLKCIRSICNCAGGIGRRYLWLQPAFGGSAHR